MATNQKKSGILASDSTPSNSYYLTYYNFLVSPNYVTLYYLSITTITITHYFFLRFSLYTILLLATTITTITLI